MSRPNRLDDTAIAAALATLPGWSRSGDKLHREYQFASFVMAFAFMSAVALVAEKLDHHPEWWNVYRTVRVDLATHDAGGITELDVQLARAMEDLARPLGAQAT